MSGKRTRLIIAILVLAIAALTAMQALGIGPRT
ncbi:putative small secreted protein [Nonomuraea africana]|uniref:Small secreted protein n=1 Tax=Nonomuraea africana TaxID=46171 RepID=A0ABR9KWH1_9ACTN|nr:putative small secreted protein [Nonomuraea africana]